MRRHSGHFRDGRIPVPGSRDSPLAPRLEWRRLCSPPWTVHALPRPASPIAHGRLCAPTGFDIDGRSTAPFGSGADRNTGTSSSTPRNAASRRSAPAAFQLLPPRKVFMQRSFPQPRSRECNATVVPPLVGAAADLRLLPARARCLLRSPMSALTVHPRAFTAPTATSTSPASGVVSVSRIGEIRKRFAKCETRISR